MRPLDTDIAAFIRRSFDPRDVPKVLEILERHAGALSTPRVQRSVLFLSGGSLSMLRHYAETATTDVREVLTRAEYVVDVAEMPMAVRTMSAPFDDEGSAVGKSPVVPPRGIPRRAAADRSGEAKHHRHLTGGTFVLGGAEYTITTEQPNTNSVRCARRCDNVISIVHLPLVFVVEQLCEHIELNGEVY